MKNLIFHHFSKIWEFKNLCDVIKSKLGEKGVKFVYCITPPVMKIIMVYYYDENYNYYGLLKIVNLLVGPVF